MVINPRKTPIADYLEAVFPSVDFTFHVQGEPRGLGFAVLESEPLLGDTPFVMLLPDNLFVGKRGLTASLRDVYHRTRKCCLTLFRDGRIKPGAKVGLEVGVSASGDHPIRAMHQLDRIPPSVEVHTGPAAYLFTPDVFELLETGLKSWDASEGDYTEREALRNLIGLGRLCAAWVEGICFDVGTQQGYVNCLKYFLTEWEGCPPVPEQQAPRP